MKRTDIHRPSAIIPSDYEFVTIHCRDEFGTMSIGSEEFIAHRKITGGKFSSHEHAGGCDVCGAWMIDYAIFFHLPTREYIKTGCDCAAKIEEGHIDGFRRVAQLRRAAKARAEISKIIENELVEQGILDKVEAVFHEGELGGPIAGYNVSSKWHENNIDLYEKCDAMTIKTNALREDMRHIIGDVVEDFDFKLLDGAKGDIFIIADIIRGCIKYKRIPSEKQLNFLEKLVNNIFNLKEIAFKRKEEWEAAANCPEGKVKVVGEVISIKLHEGYYGDTWKMMVKDDSGFKVWTTVPKAIIEVNKGERVEFTVNLTPSNDDPKFGFGKRPSKASII